MVKNELLDELGQRVASLLPMAEELGDDIKSRLGQAVKQALADMDILTREEFDGQTEALNRAEQRIDELEKTLARLEKALETRLNLSTD